MFPARECDVPENLENHHQESTIIIFQKILAISFSWPKRNQLHNASCVEHIQSLSELKHEETLIPSMLERLVLERAATDETLIALAKTEPKLGFRKGLLFLKSKRT
jgi:hypothetical protein